MFSLFQITTHSHKQLPPIHSQTFLPFYPNLIVPASPSLAVTCCVYLPACWMCVWMTVGMNDCRYCVVLLWGIPNLSFLCFLIFSPLPYQPSWCWQLIKLILNQRCFQLQDVTAEHVLFACSRHPGSYFRFESEKASSIMKANKTNKIKQGTVHDQRFADKETWRTRFQRWSSKQGGLSSEVPVCWGHTFPNSKNWLYTEQFRWPVLANAKTTQWTNIKKKKKNTKVLPLCNEQMLQKKRKIQRFYHYAMNKY